MPRPAAGISRSPDGKSCGPSGSDFFKDLITATNLEFLSLHLQALPDGADPGSSLRRQVSNRLGLLRQNYETTYNTHKFMLSGPPRDVHFMRHYGSHGGELTVSHY